MVISIWVCPSCSFWLRPRWCMRVRRFRWVMRILSLFLRRRINSFARCRVWCVWGGLRVTSWLRGRGTPRRFYRFWRILTGGLKRGTARIGRETGVCLIFWVRLCWDGGTRLGLTGCLRLRKRNLRYTIGYFHRMRRYSILTVGMMVFWLRTGSRRSIVRSILNLCRLTPICWNSSGTWLARF
jgi:hypothetical protein